MSKNLTKSPSELRRLARRAAEREMADAQVNKVASVLDTIKAGASGQVGIVMKEALVKAGVQL